MRTSKTLAMAAAAAAAVTAAGLLTTTALASPVHPVASDQGLPTYSVKTILNAGIADGTLRADVRPEDVVAMVVGAFSATSLDAGHEQRSRMFDLLVDAVRASRN